MKYSKNIFDKKKFLCSKLPGTLTGGGCRGPPSVVQVKTLCLCIYCFGYRSFPGVAQVCSAYCRSQQLHVESSPPGLYFSSGSGQRKAYALQNVKHYLKIYIVSKILINHHYITTFCHCHFVFVILSLSFCHCHFVIVILLLSFCHCHFVIVILSSI